MIAISAKFGQRNLFGYVFINYTDCVSDLHVIWRATDNVAPHVNSFLELDDAYIVRHIFFPSGTVTVAHYE
jgi:hypothetical protein